MEAQQSGVRLERRRREAERAPTEGRREADLATTTTTGGRARALPTAVGAIKAFKEVYHESKTVREAHVREVQDHQAQGQSHGYLRKPQA